MKRDCAAKQLFLVRLSAIMLDKSFHGFVNDTAIALHKSKLYYVMLKYVEDGSIPTSPLWKKSVTSSLIRFYVNEWEARTSTTIMLYIHRYNRNIMLLPYVFIHFIALNCWGLFFCCTVDCVSSLLHRIWIS